jgi:vitamin B12 transporter
MRSLLVSSAALCALLPAVAFAPSLAFANDVPPVSEVVVTAPRLDVRPDQITGLRVINRVELDARGTTFLTDVLSTIPGVSIARNGAFGGVSAIRIRGASPDKTLVLIDGVPVDDPADPNGAFDPANIQTDDLERIEVLSGPQGSLWGSSAIGGVVALTTRELDGFRLQGEAGSMSTARGFAGAGVRTDAYALSANIAGFRTDGISKAASGTEKDGDRNVTANLAGRYTISDTIQVAGRLRYTTSKTDIDGFPAPTFALGDTPDSAKSHAWSGFGGATVEALGLTHRLSVSDYEIKRTNISSFPSRYEADRQVYRWTAEKQGETGGFTVGAERENTHADLDSRPSDDLSTTSAFVTGARKFDRLTLTGALRYDDPDAFKGRATARLSAAVDAGMGFTVTASAGQGFKTPTISQVACDFCFAPPVALKPEKADGYDLRLGWTSPDGRFTGALTGYELNVRDQISYVASRYINIAKARTSGLEAEGDLLLSDALRVKLAYALTDAVDRSTNKSLLRVPDHSGSAALFWTGGKFNAAFTLRGESSQSDTATDGFSSAVRKGFVTADIGGSWKLTDRFALTGRIENLSDKHYQETLGYGEAGRAVYVGFRFTN